MLQNLMRYLFSKPSVIPKTFEEAVASIDSLISKDTKYFLRTGGENAAIQLHSTLGRYLRNKWELWADSELAQYMRSVKGINHPDDMSHAILVAYSHTVSSTDTSK